jgi:hypothetical protein
MANGPVDGYTPAHPRAEFEMLRLARMNHNRKLPEIADRVVLTGTLDPDYQAQR